MESLLPELMPVLANGGITVILFLIWWFTFQRSNHQYDAAVKHSNQLYREAIEHSNRLFSDAIDRHQHKLDEITSILKEEVRAKEMLAGAISRLEKTIENQGGR